MLRRWCLFLAGLLLVSAAFAATPEETITAKLKLVIPDVVITEIKLSPVPGFYQVSAEGYDTVYMTGDGRYMLQGDLVELRGSQLISVSEEAMAGKRKAALAALDRKQTIVFPAKTKTRAVVYVFTDVDCPYCRKLHLQVPKMNAMGIEVRYLAFPRTGIHSVAAAKMDKVWCAVDRNTAISDAKMGDTKPQQQQTACKSPVADQYNLGLSLGVHGTPTVLLEDGTEVGGYLPAEELASDLNLK